MLVSTNSTLMKLVARPGNTPVFETEIEALAHSREKTFLCRLVCFVVSNQPLELFSQQPRQGESPLDRQMACPAKEVGRQRQGDVAQLVRGFCLGPPHSFSVTRKLCHGT